MSEYRLYFMDRYSGHIEHSREFTAENDATAIEAAEERINGQRAELWQRHRKVQTWEAVPYRREASS